ncbi:TPA: conjugative relaxase [Legionella pneumophila subsp. pneumophila]|nr:conjugative relaxase [Legionella pneumophila subsp. pneumophila]
MLSHQLLTRKDIGKTARYYQDAVDDYYAEKMDATAWQGQGAEELGLTGAVEPERFRELLAGKIDEQTEIGRNSVRSDNKIRLGIDLTFSAPKSVSLQALVHGDIEIIKAHEQAVARAIEMAETRARARKKVMGKSMLETTGNLVVAKFRHETSRAQDPQLHTHAIVLNMTKRQDGAWRALKNDEIIQSTRFLGAIYNSELAEGLQKSGYSLKFGRDGNFELAHITREHIEAFSQRSQEVEAYLKAQGLDRESATSLQKQQATVLSRQKKTSLDRETLHSAWQEQAKVLGISFKKIPYQLQPAQSNAHIPAEEAAKQSLQYAIQHLTERQSIIFERDLMDLALQHAVGRAKLSHLEKEMVIKIEKGELLQEQPLYYPSEEMDAQSTQPLTRTQWIEYVVKTGVSLQQAKTEIHDAIVQGKLVQSEMRYTTPDAVVREKCILQLEREGRNRLQPILPKERAHNLLQDSDLNKGQQAAASLILSTSNRIVGVQGYAGTGKSHMLDKTKQLIEAAGFNVRALAPYGNQVKALQELNVKANTLASFIRGKDKDINEKTVLVIDEAGVVPTRLMEKVLQLAEKARSRVVLLGDTAQTKAIEAGRPFDQLQTAGMQTAFMDTIQRQKNAELKKAVELAATGRSAHALKHVHNVFEIKDHQTRQYTIAKEYVQLPEDERTRTIIVTGTNEARREINKQVRVGLNLQGTGITCDTLIRRDTTRAERMYAKHYRIGDFIQPEKNYPRCGLKRGELYRVEDTAIGNRLIVRSMENQQTLEFNPMTYRKLSVYEPDRKELSAGDFVRITRNDKDLDLANGDRFKIASVAEDQVILSNGLRSLTLDSKQPLHLDYAYTTTVHSSQGLTADRVLIDIHAQSRTTAKDVFYVALSRARFEAKIYTNDKNNLPSAISRNYGKLAALDLTRDILTSNRR